MTPKQKARLLVAAGFVLIKSGSRHELYGKNGVFVPVPLGADRNPRAVSSLKAAIRRAERGRATAPGRYV